MNCRGCGHPAWKHKTGMNGTTCDAGVNPRGELEPCGCRSWINREESEVTSSDIGMTSSDIGMTSSDIGMTSSDIGMTSSDIPDGVALLDGRTWSVVAAEALPDGDRMARLSPVKNELAEWGIGTVDPDSSRPHDICGSDCWCNPTVETVPASTSGNGEPRALYEINYVNSLMDERNELRDEVDRLRRDASDTTVETIPAKGMGGASRPAQWRHADGCGLTEFWADRCYCGLDAFRDAIEAGHRVVVGPDGALADPAPVGLTEDEREQIETIRLGCYHADGTPKPGSMHKRILLEALDRLEGEVLLDGKRMRLEQVGEYERRATYDDAPLYRLVPVSPSVDPEEG